MTAPLSKAYPGGVTEKATPEVAARALEEVAVRWEAAHPPEILAVDHGHDGRCGRRLAAIRAWRAHWGNP